MFTIFHIFIILLIRLFFFLLTYWLKFCGVITYLIYIPAWKFNSMIDLRIFYILLLFEEYHMSFVNLSWNNMAWVSFSSLPISSTKCNVVHIFSPIMWTNWISLSRPSHWLYDDYALSRERHALNIFKDIWEIFRHQYLCAGDVSKSKYVCGGGGGGGGQGG